ncbi:tubby-like F-box protein 5 isoform X2 [Rhodamnia argentea]|uniref:Tubby-like F-box protein n=1 Tax=Rhodamnia argentea TaxID=178133 RepID=A0ABM3H329_9MYRT|nr:tubby-like F-box protein 5 isoform X2 [Rhodamnia argentea]
MWAAHFPHFSEAGPRDFPIQCFIRRDTQNSTFFLYLGLSPGLSEERSKLLLAARKIRRATNTDFVISLVADDFSQAGISYVGKLRSNFIGTKFTVYDSQPPWDAAIKSNQKSHGRMKPKQVSPRVPSGKFSVATISYELNVLRSRGPRRMHCKMHSIPSSAIQEGGTAPTPTEFSKRYIKPCLLPPPLPASNGKKQLDEHSSTSHELLKSTHGEWDPLVLRNKAPRWHEQLQCWCLNFRGRVTVASVKNFQLVTASEPYQNIPAAEQDNVILQFGKIGKDIFTMDYRYPLSAFQAFAISLSSFGTKPACE